MQNTKSVASSTPLTTPAIKAAQFNAPNSFGTEMNLFVTGAESKIMTVGTLIPNKKKEMYVRIKYIDPCYLNFVQ